MTRETPHRQPGDAVDPLRCYRVQWKSLSADTHPTDCFDMGDHLWYGGGVILGRQHGFAGQFSQKVTTGSSTEMELNSDQAGR